MDFNGKTFVGGKSRITINGTTIEVDGPASITSRNGEITINGVNAGNFAGKTATIKIEGNVVNDVKSDGDVNISGDVGGNVDAGSSVRCKSVGKNVNAGSSVTCENVEGQVDAGASVTCGNVKGNVSAGASVRCNSAGSIN